MDFLEKRPVQPYLIHCFAGGSGDLDRALKLNCLIGVDGPVTYKRSTELRENIKLAGLGRIVLETDSPYLTPEPHRGKTNHPAYVRLVGEAVASCLGVGIEEVAARTTENARRFFRMG